MATIRQNKVARLIQKELGDIFQKETQGFLHGAMVSVTIVRMSPDLGLAKCYLSIFAPGSDDEHIETIRKHKREIRHVLAGRVRHQLRVVPELAFFIDDSMEYAAKIDELLKK